MALETRNVPRSGSRHGFHTPHDEATISDASKKWQIPASVEDPDEIAQETVAIRLLERTRLMLAPCRNPVIGIATVGDATTMSPFSQHVAKIAARSGPAALVRSYRPVVETRRTSLMAAWTQDRSLERALTPDPDIAALSHADLTPRPSPRLEAASDSMDEIFGALRSCFSTVILDTGRVATHEHRHAALCSGVWLTISAFRDSVTDARLSLAALHAAEANILGAIFLRQRRPAASHRAIDHNS